MLSLRSLTQGDSMLTIPSDITGKAVTIIVLIAVACLIFAGGVYGGLFMRSDYVPQEQVDEMIGEHTRAMSAARTDYEQVIDSLKATNESLHDHIEKKEEEVLVYSEMALSLRIERDSLKERQSFDIPTEWFNQESDDTANVDYKAVEFNRTFNNNLFEVTSNVYAMEGQLFNDLDLSINRQIDLNITVTERPESETYIIYAHVPEMQIDEMMTYRPVKKEPPKVNVKENWFKRNLFSKRIIFVGGALVGFIINENI